MFLRTYCLSFEDFIDNYLAIKGLHTSLFLGILECVNMQDGGITASFAIVRHQEHIIASAWH